MSAKEWTTEEAIEVVHTILCDNFTEDSLSDDAAYDIAKLIVTAFEKGPQ